jgi:hypothetical protein
MGGQVKEAEKMEVLRALVLQKLQGGVWHTTNMNRFQGILRCSAILPEPEIPESERWLGYSYVRTLGGVSLFDFRQFNREQYWKDFPRSNWDEFVPYRMTWNEAVWIEIDVDKLGNAFLSGVDLLARWNAAKVGNRIMPEIEAAHVGLLPRTTFKNVFTVRKGSDTLYPVRAE